MKKYLVKKMLAGAMSTVMLSSMFFSTINVLADEIVTDVNVIEEVTTDIISQGLSVEEIQNDGNFVIAQTDEITEINQDTFTGEDNDVVSLYSGEYRLKKLNYKLTTDIDISGYILASPSTIMDGTDLIIDLNGKTLTVNNLNIKVMPSNSVVIKNGTLILLDKDTTGLVIYETTDVAKEILLQNLNVQGTVDISGGYKASSVIIDGGKYSDVVDAGDIDKVIIDGGAVFEKGFSSEATELWLKNCRISGKDANSYGEYAFCFTGIGQSEDSKGKVILGLEDGEDSDVVIDGDVLIVTKEFVANHFTLGTQENKLYNSNIEVYESDKLILNGGIGNLFNLYFSIYDTVVGDKWSDDKLLEFAKKYFADNSYKVSNSYLMLNTIYEYNYNTREGKDIFYFNAQNKGNGGNGDTGNGNNGGNSGTAPGAASTTEKNVTLDNKGTPVNAVIITKASDANGTPLPAGDLSSHVKIDKNKVVFDKANDMPKLEGYTFKGWFSAGKKVSKIAANKLTDMTVVATYVENVYNITYKLDKPTGTKVSAKAAPLKKVKYSEEKELVKDLTASNAKTGESYKLIGWAKVKGAAKPDYAPGEKISKLGGQTKKDKKVVLYPVWQTVQ